MSHYHQGSKRFLYIFLCTDKYCLVDIQGARHYFMHIIVMSFRRCFLVIDNQHFIIMLNNHLASSCNNKIIHGPAADVRGREPYICAHKHTHTRMHVRTHAHVNKRILHTHIQTCIYMRVLEIWVLSHL